MSGKKGRNNGSDVVLVTEKLSEPAPISMLERNAERRVEPPSPSRKAQNAMSDFGQRYGIDSVIAVQIITLVETIIPGLQRSNRDKPVDMTKQMAHFFGHELSLNNLIDGEKLSDRAMKNHKLMTLEDQRRDALEMLDICAGEPVLALYVKTYQDRLKVLLNMVEPAPVNSARAEEDPWSGSNI